MIRDVAFCGVASWGPRRVVRYGSRDLASGRGPRRSGRMEAEGAPRRFLRTLPAGVEFNVSGAGTGSSGRFRDGRLTIRAHRRVGGRASGTGTRRDEFDPRRSAPSSGRPDVSGKDAAQ